VNRATMMAALLGTALALPDSAAAPAAADTSAVTAPEAAASGGPTTGTPFPGKPEEVVSAPFSVESVDRASRSLIVRSPDGLLTTVRVAPTAEGFDTVEKGDRIGLDYYRSSVVSLGPPKGAAGGDHAPTRANAPVLGAAGGRQLTSKAHVTGVDSQAGTLEITTPDGKPHTLAVEDPAARIRLRSLGEGDEVTVTYTEAVAIGVHPAEGT
jgi:hypothetical protein